MIWLKQNSKLLFFFFRITAHARDRYEPPAFGVMRLRPKIKIKIESSRGAAKLHRLRPTRRRCHILFHWLIYEISSRTAPAPLRLPSTTPDVAVKKVLA